MFTSFYCCAKLSKSRSRRKMTYFSCWALALVVSSRCRDTRIKSFFSEIWDLPTVSYGYKNACSNGRKAAVERMIFWFCFQCFKSIALFYNRYVKVLLKSRGETMRNCEIQVSFLAIPLGELWDPRGSCHPYTNKNYWQWPDLLELFEDVAENSGVRRWCHCWHCWLCSTVGGTPVFGRRTDPVLRSTFRGRVTNMWVNRRWRSAN